MSFATRCPACATRFRVVADQLKISEGWVRCGQCGEVFDATRDLSPGADEPAPPAPVPLINDPPFAPPVAPASTLPVAEPAADDAGPAVELSFPDVKDGPLPKPEAQQEPAWTELEPPVWREADAAPQPAEEPTFEPTVMVPLEALEPEAVPEPQDWLSAPAQSVDEASEADLAEVPMRPEPPGFVRQAQRRAFWLRRGVRVALALGSVLLLLLLALQWVLHERHRIAALRPDLRPALVALCQPLGCRVEAMRWIDALSIDSTTLARRGGGRYGLEVVLRNASMFELALPALELSLTDARDQLLLRRVILASDWPSSGERVPAQGVLTLRLDVAIESPQAEALAGYRTLLFYP